MEVLGRKTLELVKRVTSASGGVGSCKKRIRSKLKKTVHGTLFNGTKKTSERISATSTKEVLKAVRSGLES